MTTSGWVSLSADVISSLLRRSMGRHWIPGMSAGRVMKVAVTPCPVADAC
jgi:hypothetical protein